MPRETKPRIWFELLSMMKSLRTSHPSNDSSIMSRTASLSERNIVTIEDLCMFLMDDACKLIDRQPKRVFATPALASTNCSPIEGSFTNKEVTLEQHDNIGEQNEQTLDNDFYNNVALEAAGDKECIFDILKYLKILMFLKMLLELLQFRCDDTKKDEFWLKLRRKLGYLKGISAPQYDDWG